MRWITDGISSNSERDAFLAQLEKLSGEKLAAAKQDLAKIEGFIATHLVQDFQAILDPATGRVYVNDPRYCLDRELGQKSPDQGFIADWISRVGSKPD